ncbi:MAG: hypothetical protein IPM56_15495 [Ignavibacteriales bacterium]|nr:MAG: hypothetical protein IPM56_15495 [Ignavibacteriales bacterium]
MSKIALAQSRHINFENFSIKEGLSNDIATSIIQDKDGFIWIGTEDGLNRYDGYEFKIFKFNPANPGSISDDWITRVFQDSKGNIWIGTSNGLNRYLPVTSTFKIYSLVTDDMENKQQIFGVGSIFEDKEGTLLVGTSTKGFLEYDPDEDRFLKNGKYEDLIKLTSGYFIRCFLQDKSGLLWVGIDDGVIRYNPEDKSSKHFKYKYGSDNSPSNPVVVLIKEDHDGDIWFGTMTGVDLFVRKSEKFLRASDFSDRPEYFKDKLVLALLTDSKNNIWVGGFNGLIKLDKKTKKTDHYTYNPRNRTTLSSSRIYDLMEDRAGAIWIATYKGGVNRYDPRLNKFNSYIHNDFDENSISGTGVKAFYKDRNGFIWIGTEDGGLNKFDPVKSTFKKFRYNPSDNSSLSNNSVYSITPDKNGMLWIATFGGGLNILDLKTGRIRRLNSDEIFPAGKSDVHIKYVYSDRDGDLWVTTEKSGIFRYNFSTGKLIEFELAHENTDVHSVYQDKSGTVWISTFGGGLYKYNKRTNELKRYQKDFNCTDCISSAVVYSVNEDNENNIWISTFRGGINRYFRENDNFVAFTERNGIPSNYVKGMLPDNFGNLWITTNKGLAKFNPSTLTVKVYDENDGLPSNDFLSGALMKDRDGIFYLGTVNGFVMFNPDSIIDDPYEAPLYITRFSVFGEDYKTDKNINEIEHINLAFDENLFSFEFASLDFSDPSKNQYAYMLEGIDPDWIYAGSRRYANYTHLSPGNYMFKVKATNSDGVWGKHVKEISITIVPPFWQRWWFILIAGSFIIGIILIAYQYRVNRLLELERLRTRIAADLHDEIASNLSSIAMFGKIIQDEANTPSKASVMMPQLLERIISLSQESVVSIRDIIWAIDPKTETMHDLLTRVRDMIISSCRAKQITLNYDLPNKELLPSKNLSPEQRRDMWMLLKEALSNAVKHSGCTELIVITLYDGEHIKIVIKDNGKGFNTAVNYNGKGLGTMKKRAHTLGAELIFDSAPSKGTTIILNLRF